MNEVKDGLCIIDAMSGIDCATPQIGQFTDNFDRVKFLLGKDFSDYTMMIITDVGGHVEVVNTDGDNLIKETVDGETYLLWNIGINITSQSGVIVYQIAAYKRDGDAIEETWYSKEGRLVVTESISTNEYSASLIGSYPNLLTRLLIESDNLKTDITDIRQSKVDVKDGFGLSENNFSDEEKEKLSAIEEGAEVNVPSDWEEDDENSDSYIKNKPLLSSVALSGSYNDLKDKPKVDVSYDGESYNAQSGKAVKEAIANLVNSSPEALDTLYELSKALGNDPNFAKTVATEMGKKVDKEEGKTLSSNDYTDADKEKLLSVQMGAEKNVISDWAEVDANSDRYIKNKPVFSSVALSGSYNDLTEKPYIPTINGLASEGYVDTGLEKKADKSTVNVALADIENLKDNKADKTTKINGKPISDDVNLTASDVGALSKDQIVEGFGIPFEVKGTNFVTIQKVHPKDHNVEVELTSKNLINIDEGLPKAGTQSSYKSLSKNNDGTYTIARLDDGSRSSDVIPLSIPKGTQLTFSIDIEETTAGDLIVIFYDENNTLSKEVRCYASSGKWETTFTITENIKEARIMCLYSSVAGQYVTFKNLQLEIGSVATPYTPYVDVESATVFGKNLCNHYVDDEKGDAHRAGLAKTNNDDGSFNLSGELKQNYSYCSKMPLFIPKGTKLVASGYWETPHDNVSIGAVVRNASDVVLLQANDLASGESKSITLTEDAGSVSFVFAFRNNAAGDLVEVNNIKLQLEIGSVATEWKAFKGGTYPVTDGKAVVKSVSPTMYITTPANDANIEAKGYQDGLAVIDELKQAIISLGGNI